MEKAICNVISRDRAQIPGCLANSDTNIVERSGIVKQRGSAAGQLRGISDYWRYLQEHKAKRK